MSCCTESQVLDAVSNTGEPVVNLEDISSASLLTLPFLCSKCNTVRTDYVLMPDVYMI